MTETYQVVYPEGYHDRREAETPAKGWLDVEVEFSNGSTCPVSFYDPVRLSQTVADEFRAGSGYYTEPNLIVVPEVSTESIEHAIKGLVAKGWFDRFAYVR